MSDNVIIEVDLSIHPYQGIIGCFQDKWTGWLEPGFIFYLPRDSPISYNIFPGDYILCKKEPIYECAMGHVLMPIKKITFDEIIDIITKEPKIKIYEWDKLSDKKTVFNLVKQILQTLIKLEQKNTLTNNQVNKLAQNLEELFKIPEVDFLYPEAKLKALEIISERLNSDFFERILKQLTKYNYQLYDRGQTQSRYNQSYYVNREEKKVGILRRNELLTLLFPEIRLASRKFTLGDDIVSVFNRIIASESNEKDKYDELKLEIMTRLEQFINTDGTGSFNIEWFKSVNFDDLKKRVLDIRVKQVNDITISYTDIDENGQKKTQYNISGLRATYLGKRLLASLQISDSISWIEEPMFNLIKAALSKFKVTLKTLDEKSWRKKFAK